MKSGRVAQKKNNTKMHKRETRPVGPDGYTGLARTIKQNGGVISREGICVTLAEELIDKPCMLPLALADVPLEKDSF